MRDVARERENLKAAERPPTAELPASSTTLVDVPLETTQLVKNCWNR